MAGLFGKTQKDRLKTQHVVQGVSWDPGKGEFASLLWPFPLCGDSSAGTVGGGG